MSPASSPRRLLSDLIARLFGRHRGERPDPDPPRPAALDGLENLPQHVTVLPNSAAAVKRLIEQALA